MDSNILGTIITSVTAAASTSGVAITALILNNKRFDLMEKRLDKIDRTLEVIQLDLKEFFKDIAQLKARTGLE